MAKRNLTKIIKKRRLNYKPTIGITLKAGDKISVNAVEYYAAIRTEEKDKLRREKLKEQKIAHDIMREVFPSIAALEDILLLRGDWTYF